MRKRKKDRINSDGKREDSQDEMDRKRNKKHSLSLSLYSLQKR